MNGFLELQEQVYSKLYVEHSNAQILLCKPCDYWRNARKAKETEVNLIPKSGFTATFFCGN